MKSLFFGIAGAGLLALGAHAQPATTSAPAPIRISLASVEPDASETATAGIRIAPPSDLEDDDSGDYMKTMTPAELEKLYAEHDAEVARLMAAAPDEHLVGAAFMIDPTTGERVSIDLIAF